MKETYLLFECSAGYFLLKVNEWDYIGNNNRIEENNIKTEIVNKIVKFISFVPFGTSEIALDNIINISKGIATRFLLNFLELNLKENKKTYELGVSDLNLAKYLTNIGFNVIHNQNILELLRLCRYHYLKNISKYINNDNLNIKHFNVGLGHTYSRSIIKTDPKKQDKSIINSIATIEFLDKNINLLSMRICEWYSLHFPELKKIITDTYIYCKLVKLIKIKENFDFKENEKELLEIVKSEEIVKEITKTSKVSIGQDISEDDLNNILNFANEVIKLSDTRRILAKYMDKKLNLISPNLKELLGNTLTARLISHAGSLVNLAKSPSSTIQLLGAEKALFNSLKEKSRKTPKYGLLFNASYISKAPSGFKGRMSRYLSNKSAIAARIDFFSDVSTNSFGVYFKKQLEEKLLNIIKGVKLSKNIDFINEAYELFEKEKKEKKNLENIQNIIENNNENNIENNNENNIENNNENNIGNIETDIENMETDIESDIENENEILKKNIKNKQNINMQNGIENNIQNEKEILIEKKKKK